MTQGLSNSGGRNLCYQNSVLQCLLRTPPFRRSLNGTSGELHLSVRGVAEHLELPAGDTRAVERFRRVVGEWMLFPEGLQHDAGEFVITLLNKLAAADPRLPSTGSLLRDRVTVMQW